MQADEEGVAKGVGDRRTVVVRRIGIIIPGHHHAKALALEFRPRNPGEQKNDILLDGTARSACAAIRAAMRWVKNDDRPAWSGPGRNGRGGRGWLRDRLWRQLLRGRLCGRFGRLLGHKRGGASGKNQEGN